MATWYSSSDTVVLGAAPPWANDIVILVEPGTGSVQIQYEDSGAVWFTPADEAFTILTKGPVLWSRRNSPPMKIVAVGDAKFQVYAQ